MYSNTLYSKTNIEKINIKKKQNEEKKLLVWIVFEVWVFRRRVVVAASKNQ